MADANISIPVQDMDAAREHYTRVLGVEPYVDGPYYTGFAVGGFEVGLAPGLPQATTYVTVPDLDAALAEAARAGSVVEPAREVGGGMRVAVVADPEGHRLGLKTDS